MFSSNSGNTVIKSKLISRRMFVLTSAKVIVLVGVLGRLISFKLMKVKNIKHYLTKIGLGNGNWHPREV